MRGSARTLGIALLFFVGVLAITLLFGATVFGVPPPKIPAVAGVLAAVGGGGGLLALGLTHRSVLGRAGSVRSQLVTIGLICGLLLAGMVLVGAWAMFVSKQDLAILLTMLLFAALLTVGVSVRAATPLARRIERVRAGATRLAGGDLETEVPDEGRDEVSALAQDFNHAARALEVAERRKHETERTRRDLIAAVSHDLRTPLASVRALVEAVADGVVADPETEARYLSSARSELAHLGRLVDDLFEFARIDAGLLRANLEKTSLHDMVSDALSSFQPQAEGRGVRLIGEVPGGVDSVLADPPKLQRVLYNLIDNAIRHTPPDGTVALRAEPEGDMVRVEVADTGEGIAPEDLPRVFERSFRGEEPQTRREKSVPGAGLGLTIARGLIEAHGGMIDVESRPGHGSRFRFTLRRA